VLPFLKILNMFKSGSESIKAKFKQINLKSFPIKIAVTGGAGSGKTFVCNRLRECGMKVINSDVLARQVVAPGSAAFEKIVKYFGKTILTRDGTLNRPMLRRIITNDADSRKALEGFVHPEIIRRMHQKMTEAVKYGHFVVVAEVPLLFEIGMEDQFDLVILVRVDDKLKIKRLMDRDHVSFDEAKALLSIQMPDKLKVEKSDIIIENNGSIEKVIATVDLVFKKMQKITKTLDT